MVPTGTVPHDISISEDRSVQDVTGFFKTIRNSLRHDGLFRDDEPDAWRIARQPFQLESSEVSFLEQLGDHLLAFSRSLNRLYLESLKGQQPTWVHQYFDQGKPESLLSFARMNRFKNVLPDIIRPDIILTETGMIITELDSVPGGMGLTGSLSRTYHRMGEDIVGGPDGLPKGFASSLLERVKEQCPPMAIVVSEESESYRSEMEWLTKQLRSQGLSIACVPPQDLSFRDNGIFLSEQFGDQAISVVYRFFELFDLPNIPKFELLMYAAKKGLTAVTPPYKPWLEEKLAFALVHHPMLKHYWEANLPDETFQLLQRLIPRTWILDPRPIPPMGVIPGLTSGARAISDWSQLDTARQKERQFVVKPSGFSELAWGSRGVSIGHDLSQVDWVQTLKTGLESFSRTPYILQEFHKGRLYKVDYYDQTQEKWTIMEGRVRLSPYYFVTGDTAKLSGILSTVCPKDKKIIHGMRDAVMMPCGTKFREN